MQDFAAVLEEEGGKISNIAKKLSPLNKLRFEGIAEMIQRAYSNAENKQTVLEKIGLRNDAIKGLSIDTLFENKDDMGSSFIDFTAKTFPTLREEAEILAKQYKQEGAGYIIKLAYSQIRDIEAVAEVFKLGISDVTEMLKMTEFDDIIHNHIAAKKNTTGEETTKESYNPSSDIDSPFVASGRPIAQAALGGIQIVDIPRISDEEIKSSFWTCPFFLLLKHGRRWDTSRLISETQQAFQQIMQEPKGEEYVDTMLWQFLYNSDGDSKAFEKNLENLPKELLEKVMSMAEKLKLLGKKEGLKEGREKERSATVMNLMKKLKSKPKVANMLGMKISAIEKILEKKSAKK